MVLDPPPPPPAAPPPLWPWLGALPGPSAGTLPSFTRSAALRLESISQYRRQTLYYATLVTSS